MNRVRIAVALVVTIVWALGCVLAFVVNTQLIGLASLITPVMLAVVGWLFTQEILDRKVHPPRELEPATAEGGPGE